MRTIIISAVCVVLAACQTTSTSNVLSDNCIKQTPLPTEMSVERPSEGVPEEIAAFSGMWSNGKWDDKLCHTLVVTSVDATGNAEAIYSYGRYAGWDTRRPEYFEPSGKITDGILTLETFRNGADVKYWIEGAELKGSYTRGDSTSYVTLSKIVQ